MGLWQKYSAIFDYIKLMGLDWTLFRIQYSILKKLKYFDFIDAKILQKSQLLENEKFTMPKLDWINHTFIGDKTFVKKADCALEGKIYAFSHTYLDYKDHSNMAWNINPISKIKADQNISWHRLADFGSYGDIKLIWEASRFPQVYYFIQAYSQTKDDKYAKACLEEIIDWIDSNPYPKGVHYKCGQEITFRVIAWMVAIDYFRIFLTPEDEKKIVKSIYISILRVEANIAYAARAVKNNHSISESVGLILFGLYFTQFKESESMLQKGVKYLIKEVDYQVYEDGSYIQHSFTYERLALDLVSFVRMVSAKKEFVLPEIIQQKHQKMIYFLYAFVQKNGWLPNYGSNDGANLFPISASDYRDFQESLNFSAAVAMQSTLFASHKSIINFFGIETHSAISLQKYKRFDAGGYYILSNKHVFIFTRCHSYKDRPAQNDMLHVDIWYQGENIFCDTGSFSYNTDKTFKNNFSGAVGHNTIMINDDNQMYQVLNFGWSNWTQAKLIDFSQSSFVGEHYGYQKQYGIICQRVIRLEADSVTIIDKISGITQNTDIKQLWNTKKSVTQLDAYCVQIGNCILQSNFMIKLEKAYISDYYNDYVEGTKIVIALQQDQDVEITTTMEFLK